MKAERQSLFGSDDLSDQAYVEGKVQPFYPLFAKAITESLGDVLERRGFDQDFVDLTENDLANWLHFRIRKQLTDLREQYHRSEIQIRQKRHGSTRMFAVVIDDVTVSVKKLQPNMLRSNAKTIHQGKYWGSSPTLFDKEHRVIFGFTLEKADTEAKLWLVRPIGRKVNAWISPVSDQSDLIALRYPKPLRVAAMSASEERIEPTKGFQIDAAPRKGEHAIQ